MRIRVVVVAALTALTITPAFAQTPVEVAAPREVLRLLGLDDASTPLLSFERAIRQLHSSPLDWAAHPQADRIETLLEAPVSLAPDTVLLPLPVAHEVWEREVFGRAVPPGELFGAILRDRRASLLYVGLLGMREETRDYLAGRPGVLAALYRAASAVGAFGDALVIGDDGRLAVPGGPEAVPLWEGLVGERVAEPDRFAQRLFERDGGRMAYFYDAVAHLDPPHQRFALGAWMSAGAGVWRDLYEAFQDVDSQWSVDDRPFARPLDDPAVLLNTVVVRPDGRPAAPAERRLWDRVFDGIDVPDAGNSDMRGASANDLVDAGWLARQLVSTPARDRGARLAQLGFGQRVFANAAFEELQDVFVALRGYARFPAAMLTLERMGVVRPATYVAVTRRALAIEQAGGPERVIPLLTQFQGALALLDRLHRTGALDTDAAETLVADLAAIPMGGASFGGGLARWLEAALLSRWRTDGARTAEETLLEVLADTAPEGRLVWEGLTYRVAPGQTARRTLEGVRARQGGNSLDLVLEFARAVDDLGRADTLAAVDEARTGLLGFIERLAPARPWPGAENDVPDHDERLTRAARDLGRITEEGDVRRVLELTEPLTELGDYLLGEVLAALAYAPSLGRPGRGPEADISHRHNFGFASRVNEGAAGQVAWSRPVQDAAVAGGQAVTGSLLGIDLALSDRHLRRLAGIGIPRAPMLNPNDRFAMTDGLALLNPRMLTDADLMAVGQAVTAGRERLRRAGTDAAALAGLADEASMSGTRRSLLRWAAARAPDSVAELFAVEELFWLGASPDAIDLSQWGTTREPLDGCYCLRMPRPGAWDRWKQRTGGRQLGAAVAGVGLRVAEVMADLALPSAIYPDVMAMAVQDYLEDAPAHYADDWAALGGQVHAITPAHVEDYVAALTAAGPLRPAAGGGGGQ